MCGVGNEVCYQICIVLLSSYEIFNFYPYSQSNNHLLVILDLCTAI